MIGFSVSRLELNDLCSTELRTVAAFSVDALVSAAMWASIRGPSSGREASGTAVAVPEGSRAQ